MCEILLSAYEVGQARVNRVSFRSRLPYNNLEKKSSTCYYPVAKAELRVLAEDEGTLLHDNLWLQTRNKNRCV